MFDNISFGQMIVSIIVYLLPIVILMVYLEISIMVPGSTNPRQILKRYETMSELPE